MKWSDEGIILSVVPFSENEARLSVLTQNNGRQSGLYRLLKRQPSLHIGDMVVVTWNARLSEHLGRFVVERKISLASRMFNDPWKLWLLQHACGLMTTLPERHSYPQLYTHLMDLLLHITMDSDYTAFAHMSCFEKITLAELGFGIDLSMCCLNQTTEHLAYISPKTGRAISMKAATEGEAHAYINQLLPLPPFWLTHMNYEKNSIPQWHDILNGFRVMEHFWHKWLFNEKQTFPSIRRMIITYTEKKVALI